MRHLDKPTIDISLSKTKNQLINPISNEET